MQFKTRSQLFAGFGMVFKSQSRFWVEIEMVSLFHLAQLLGNDGVTEYQSKCCPRGKLSNHFNINRIIGYQLKLHRLIIFRSCHKKSFFSSAAAAAIQSWVAPHKQTCHLLYCRLSRSHSTSGSQASFVDVFVGPTFNVAASLSRIFMLLPFLASIKIRKCKSPFRRYQKLIFTYINVLSL